MTRPNEYPRRILVAVTGLATYNDTVEAARSALGPAELLIDLETRRVRAAGKVFSLPPAELALLSVFARRAITQEPPLPAPHKDSPDLDWAERYLAELRHIAGSMGDLDETERALRKGMDGGYFSTHLLKLRKIVKRELGPGADPYLISDSGTRPRRYRLNLPFTALCYASLDAAPH